MYAYVQGRKYGSLKSISANVYGMTQYDFMKIVRWSSAKYFKVITEVAEIDFFKQTAIRYLEFLYCYTEWSLLQYTPLLGTRKP